MDDFDEPIIMFACSLCLCVSYLYIINIVGQCKDPVFWISLMQTVLVMTVSIQRMGYRHTPKTKKGEITNKRYYTDISECTICQENVKKRAIMKCGHSLCRKCYNKIDLCPFCRSPKQLIVIQNDIAS